MAHVLPQLPYHYDSLEPFIDARTMEIHYIKHHGGYVKKLNTALEKYPEWMDVAVDELLKRIDEVPEDIRTTVRNNGGGHSNHTLFWQCMSPVKGQEPKGDFLDTLQASFDSLENFKAQFSSAAQTRFGSGWVWLVADKDKNLSIVSTPNQDSPLMDGLQPLLGLDVWEHAYYLKYQNKRPEYIERWWNIVNWEFIENQYKAL